MFPNNNFFSMGPIVYIMGVAGAGKTTVGRLLAAATGLPFLDADDFHSAGNKEKMGAGVALSDADRADWLQSVHAAAVSAAAAGGAVIACSALKASYRSLLQQGLQRVHWCHLQGAYETIAARMSARQDHFMPPSLLASQFAALEPPAGALSLPVTEPPETLVRLILQHMASLSDFGVIGLGVMGRSLARNLAGKGIALSVYNRHLAGKEEGVAAAAVAHYPELQGARPFDDLALFVGSLVRPAKILLMIDAGPATDAVLQQLAPLLAPGDVVIDGGNAHFSDTARRQEAFAALGLHWVGCGISGGEEGALKGPSLMPGGDATIYPLLQPWLEAIAATDFEGRPCCRYVGPGGSGHFVKMVHNGVEYAEMQLLAEAYQLLRTGMQLHPGAIANVLQQWQHTDASGYLLDISGKILQKREGEDWLIDLIADEAASKGTGSWAAQTAAALGEPAGLMTTALYARYLSAQRELRALGRQHLAPSATADNSLTADRIFEAYRLARIINHHQGFSLIANASAAYSWNLQLADLAALWTNGCIIRSALMERSVGVLRRQPSLLHDAAVQAEVVAARPALAAVVSTAALNGWALPAFSEALQYLHGIAASNSPMNLIQAQRDYFGAHTYRLKGDPDGPARHTLW